jgi:hypothetical protein
MLKKMLTGVLAAGALAVPLAAVASADPTPNPNPPAVPESNGQSPTNPATPGVPGSNGQGPICVVSANTPTQGTTTQGMTAQGTTSQGTTAQTSWRQVATLQGSVASDLGLPAGQPMKVFCAPAGSQNPQGQPASAENAGQTNTGPINPAMNPAQNLPGQTGPTGPTGPQNPVPGQQ